MNKTEFLWFMGIVIGILLTMGFLGGKIQMDNGKACEARGGVYVKALTREGYVCVSKEALK